MRGSSGKSLCNTFCRGLIDDGEVRESRGYEHDILVHRQHRPRFHLWGLVDTIQCSEKAIAAFQNISENSAAQFQLPSSSQTQGIDDNNESYEKLHRTAASEKEPNGQFVREAWMH